MYSHLNKVFRSSGIKVIILVSAFLISSCSVIDLNGKLVERDGVKAMTSGEPHVLDAKQIINVLRLVGLDNAEIIRHGPAVRRNIATHGGAFIKKNGSILSGIAVISNNVYISLNDGRTFTVKL